MKKEYIHTGKCIWCDKSKPEVTFKTEPHIIPESLGGKEIGTDVCDQCNSYFGTATKVYRTWISYLRRYSTRQDSP